MSLRRAFTTIIGPVSLAAILFIGNVASAANCCLINTVVRMSAGVVEDEQACKDLARSLQYTYVPNASPSEDTQQCIEAGGLDESTPTISNPLDNPELSVKVPGLTLSDSTCDADGCSTPWLADYIQGLYQYGIGAIAILAVIGLMIGGILWTTSAGNQERVGDARKWVGGSLMGVLISVTAYTVLTIINPALIELSPIKIGYIAQEIIKEEQPDTPGTNAPGATDADTADCPPGVTTIQQYAEYYAKQKTLYYSQDLDKRGKCLNGKCYCDCSSFGNSLSTCTHLKKVAGEGTSAKLWANPTKIKITQQECNNPTMKPGDVIVKIKDLGHVMTYIGNGKIVECGGRDRSNSIRNGEVEIFDFKEHCGYFLDKNAYFIRR